MRYKYCPKCRKAYIKSRLEGDRCIYCGAGCETLDVKRNGLYYLGYGMMLAGAALVVAPRFAESAADPFYLPFGLALAVGGMALVIMGSVKMAKTAVEMAMAEEKR